MQSHKPTDGMKLGLPGATFKFVHETIRIINMCYYTDVYIYASLFA